VPGFRKRRLPAHVAQRRIRPVAGPLIDAAKYVPWLLLGPLAICFQALPHRELGLQVSVNAR